MFCRWQQHPGLRNRITARDRDPRIRHRGPQQALISMFGADLLEAEAQVAEQLVELKADHAAKPGGPAESSKPGGWGRS